MLKIILSKLKPYKSNKFSDTTPNSFLQQLGYL